ncbi:MAG: ATP-binding protein [Thermoplasmata archaeon]
MLLCAKNDRIYLEKMLRKTGVRTEPRYLPEKLYGRASSLKTLKDFEMSNARICVIYGLDCMGKTTLLRSAISTYSRPNFLYEVKEGYSSSEEAFIQRFYRFLIDKNLLKHSTSIEVWNKEKIKQDILSLIENLDVVVAIDDFHLAESNLKNFLLEICTRVQASEKGLKLILTSNSKISGLKARDEVYGRILTLHLEPLSLDDVKEMFKDRNLPDDKIKEIYENTHGIPALLELVSAGSTFHPGTSYELIMEEVLGKLSENEKKVLEAGSLFQHPFEPELIFSAIDMENNIDYELLENLQERTLLKKDAFGRYIVNDTIKNFLVKTLPAGRKASIHLKIARTLEKNFGKENIVTALYHMIESENIEEIENFIARNRYILINCPSLPVIEKNIKNFLEKMRRRGKVSDKILQVYAEILETMGFWEKAENIYERLEHNPFALLKLAGLLTRKNAPAEKIIRVLSEVKKVCGGKENPELLAEYHYIHGLLAEQQGQLKEAEKSYLKTIEICRNAYLPLIEVYSWVGLARVALFNGNFEKSMEAVQKAEAVMLITDGYIERTLLYLALGGIYRMMDERGRDIEAYAGALRYAEQVGETRLMIAAYLGLSGGYIGLDKYEEAKKYFLKAETLKSEIKDWHMHLTMAAQRLVFTECHSEAFRKALGEVVKLLKTPADIPFAKHMARWCLKVIKWKCGEKLPEEGRFLLDFLA